jgi:hypothetical protein
MDKINDSLYTGDKLLRGIASIFGSIGNSFIPEKGPTSTPVIKSAKPKSRDRYPSSNKVDQKNCTSSTVKTLKNMTPEQQALYNETERNLETMSEMIGTLKEMANRIGSEVDVQSKNIDTLTVSVDHANAHLKRSTLKINRLL